MLDVLAGTGRRSPGYTVLQLCSCHSNMNGSRTQNHRALTAIYGQAPILFLFQNGNSMELCFSTILDLLIFFLNYSLVCYFYCANQHILTPNSSHIEAWSGPGPDLPLIVT